MAGGTGSTPDGRETPASMPTPPVAPMLAKLVRELPPAGDVVLEPKWDGLRCLVFRGRRDIFLLQSRNTKLLARAMSPGGARC